MHIFLTIWFSLLILSLLFVGFDAITRAPVSWVQKLAWILVTLYTGIVGAILYWIACRKPAHGDHEQFTRATWKQGLNSEMHCVAGDATGIIIAAVVLTLFHFTNGVDIIIEYIIAFISGLFIFQALMMLSMYGNYWLAVRKTFFAETVSMNCVMIGMIPVTVFLAVALTGGDDPLSLGFWLRMDMATIVGTITAFPINYWLVKKNLKHGCMTLPKKGAKMPSTMTHSMPMHKMNSLPMLQQLAWMAFTFILLLFVLYITSHFIPIRL